MKISRSAQALHQQFGGALNDRMLHFLQLILYTI
jgi:hypothetical protein